MRTPICQCVSILAENQGDLVAQNNEIKAPHPCWMRREKKLWPRPTLGHPGWPGPVFVRRLQAWHVWQTTRFVRTYIRAVVGSILSSASLVLSKSRYVLLILLLLPTTTTHTSTFSSVQQSRNNFYRFECFSIQNKVTISVLLCLLFNVIFLGINGVVQNALWV